MTTAKPASVLLVAMVGCLVLPVAQKVAAEQSVEKDDVHKGNDCQAHTANGVQHQR